MIDRAEIRTGGSTTTRYGPPFESFGQPRALLPAGLRSRATLWLVSLLFMPVMAAPFALAQNEQTVRAAFVFNLTKYVEWKQPNNSPTILIGYVGDGSMGDTLKHTLAGKLAASKTVVVLHAPSKEQMEHCDILYVSYSSPQKIRSVLDQVAGRPVLTVGEVAAFTQNGGVVGLVAAGDHIEIQVNPAAAEAAHLKINSRLLSLATLVGPAQVRTTN